MSKSSKLETNPKYFPPPVDKKSEEYHYVKHYIKEGKYPPKLTQKERDIVDRKGLPDGKGNEYYIVWTTGGRPIAAKRSGNGYIFMWDKATRRYKRNVGCFGVEYL